MLDEGGLVSMLNIIKWFIWRERNFGVLNVMWFFCVLCRMKLEKKMLRNWLRMDVYVWLKVLIC